MTDEHQEFWKPWRSFIAQTFTSLQKEECVFSLHTEPSQRHCICLLFTSQLYLPSRPKKTLNSGNNNSRKLRWIISFSSHCFWGLSHRSYKFTSRCHSKNVTDFSSSKSLQITLPRRRPFTCIVCCLWALQTCSAPGDRAALQTVQPVAFRETRRGRSSLAELCSVSAGLLPFLGSWGSCVRCPWEQGWGRAYACPDRQRSSEGSCGKDLRLTTLTQTVRQTDGLCPRKECRLLSRPGLPFIAHHDRA